MALPPRLQKTAEEPPTPRLASFPSPLTPIPSLLSHNSPPMSLGHSSSFLLRYSTKSHYFVIVYILAHDACHLQRKISFIYVIQRD